MRVLEVSSDQRSSAPSVECPVGPSGKFSKYGASKLERKSEQRGRFPLRGIYFPVKGKSFSH